MPASPSVRDQVVGIDVGGTFTDVVLFDMATGALSIAKVPSTVANQAIGVMAAIRAVQDDLRRIERVAHGTTVSTNALLQGRVSKVALLTTEGFRDAIEIGRTRRMLPSLYDPTFVRPAPLVPRPLRFEVRERLGAGGRVLTALDPASLDAAIEALAGTGTDAVAVCFLHAYANDAHERQAANAIRKAQPELAVATSSQVVPEFREYERFSTTVINASLMPIMGRYISALDESLSAAGCGNRLVTMSSSGGTMEGAAACQLPVRTILSGPAGGVAGSLWIADTIGLKDFITCDMGGTSTDVCLVEGGQPATVTEVAFAGYPIKGLQISINTVGAGGGSIAYLEAGSTLRVGPLSAGAEPGPACYGRGGVEPTVTDANVVLNRIGMGRPLGGHIKLDRERATVAVSALADRIGMSDPRHLAEGILKLAVARMASAVREITIEKGHNPSDFALMAFGGAGPMHAAALADELGMTDVVVPLYPGNLSALGLVASDQRYELVRTYLRGLSNLDRAELRAAVAAAEAEGKAMLAKLGFASEQIRFEHALDMRYARQAFEITVGLPNRPLSEQVVRDGFLASYERHYGHVDTAADIEIVNLRTTVRGVMRKPLPARVTQAAGNLADAAVGQVLMVVEGKELTATVYDRDRLPRDCAVSGPAIVEELGATTVVLPGWSCRRDAHGNLRLKKY
jgi:N-methylhydantoinase A